MNTMSAVANGMLSRGKPVMVFDWHKAARLLAERNPPVAGAGLSGDWEWTGGTIFKDGKPVPLAETYTYLSSTWATPELDIDGEIIECWLLEKDSPGWDSGTYWPQSALDILNAGRK